MSKKVPNARNVLKDYMASRKPTAYYPEGDTFDIPNHSGILSNKDFLEKADARYALASGGPYLPLAGGTLTGDVTLTNDAQLRIERTGGLGSLANPDIVLTVTSGPATKGIIAIDDDNDGSYEGSLGWNGTAWNFFPIVQANNFISDVATGTQPYATTSTTVNTNLNADKVDGFDLDQAVSTTSSPTLVALNLTADSNQIVFDSDAAVKTTLTDSASGSSKTITLPNVTGTLTAANQSITWTSGIGTYSAAGGASLNLTESTTPQSFEFEVSNGRFFLKDNTHSMTLMSTDYPGDSANYITFNTDGAVAFQTQGINSIQFGVNTFFFCDSGGSGNFNFDWATTDTFKFKIGSTDRVVITPTLADFKTSLQCDSITNDTGLAHGTYTPTLTNVANLDASTAYACQYMRVGNTVTVSGRVDIDPTLAATITQMRMSLPVASNFTANNECGGTAAASSIAGQVAAIRADAANNEAELVYRSADVTNQAMFFSFTYTVI